MARFHVETVLFVPWLIGWPIAIGIYRARHDVCGPEGLRPSGTCTPAEDYYPTLIAMVFAWFVGLVVAGFLWIGRRTR